MSSKKTPTGDYPVGYCRTPAESRFKPGQSGNPKGRKKPAQTPIEAFRTVMSTPVAFLHGGQKIQVTPLEAVMMTVRNNAMKGQMAHVRLLLRFVELAAADARTRQDADWMSSQDPDAFLKDLDETIALLEQREIAHRYILVPEGDYEEILRLDPRMQGV